MIDRLVFYANIRIYVLISLHDANEEGPTEQKQKKLLPRHSSNDDFYLLVQLEKWQKAQGRYSKDQFLTTKLSKRMPKKILPRTVGVFVV